MIEYESDEIREIQENMKKNVINLVKDENNFVLSIESANWHGDDMEYTIKIRGTD